MKIIGIGENYVEDKAEINGLKNDTQLIFTKPDSSLVTGNKEYSKECNSYKIV